MPIVDFIFLSVEDVLVNEFKTSLTNEIVLHAYYIAAINIKETFHGLLQPAVAFSYRQPAVLAPQQAADTKRQQAAAVQGAYLPFDGIVLTDTFQLTEARDYHTTGDEKMFSENNQRVA